MADDQSSSAGNVRKAAPRALKTVRPYFAALLESQPLPALLYGRSGGIIVRNSASDSLMSDNAEGKPRLIAWDGTDLWAIIEARADEANPFFDVNIKLLDHEGHVVEATFSVAPFRGSGGSLAGALVRVLAIPDERIRVEEPAGDYSAQTEFENIVKWLGEETGARRVYVVEVDPEFKSEGHVLAAWGEGPDLTGLDFSLRGTPSGSFTGKRQMCIRTGLRDVYPDDRVLVREDADAYVGTALTDAAGDPIGILAGLWSEALDDSAGACAAFAIFGRRASVVLSALRAKRELAASQALNSSVFSGSVVPILLIEPATTQLLDANEAACRFYGYPRDELLAMSFLQFDTQGPQAMMSDLGHATATTRNKFAGRHMMADGRIRDVEIYIGPIDVNGRQLLYAMVNDVSEQKRLEHEIERSRRNLEQVVAQRTQDLMRANAELQQASMARDMVFMNLAHEMRTSLQTIVGFTDVLLEGMAGELNDEQRKQIEMVSLAGKKLTSFAATLLETHRQEDAEAVCEPEAFELVGLAESVLFGLTSFAEGKGLRLELVARERPLPIETDRYKLQQILLNLISNGIRYTGRGSVTVSVGREGDDRYFVSVSDTGPGIPPEQLETIFEPAGAHDPATGIGLPASRRVAEVLGATLEAHSIPGSGSVFTLKIGRNCPDSAAERAVE